MKDNESLVVVVVVVVGVGVGVEVGKVSEETLSEGVDVDEDNCGVLEDAEDGEGGTRYDAAFLINGVAVINSEMWVSERTHFSKAAKAIVR